MGKGHARNSRVPEASTEAICTGEKRQLLGVDSFLNTNGVWPMRCRSETELVMPVGVPVNSLGFTSVGLGYLLQQTGGMRPFDPDFVSVLPVLTYQTPFLPATIKSAARRYASTILFSHSEPDSDML